MMFGFSEYGLFNKLTMSLFSLLTSVSTAARPSGPVELVLSIKRHVPIGVAVQGSRLVAGCGIPRKSCILEDCCSSFGLD